MSKHERVAQEFSKGTPVPLLAIASVPNCFALWRKHVRFLVSSHCFPSILPFLVVRCSLHPQSKAKFSHFWITTRLNGVWVIFRYTRLLYAYGKDCTNMSFCFVFNATKWQRRSMMALFYRSPSPFA